METPKITVNEALIIAKEYHLEAEVTECIKQGMSPLVLFAFRVLKYKMRRNCSVQFKER